MDFLKQRQIKKAASNILKHASHLRCLREDVTRESDLKKLSEAENEVKDALRTKSYERAEQAADNLCSCVARIFPQPSRPALRENIEILVVAVVVAMAFRTYVIQPFKIPTGSMQPTLFGVHSIASTEPTVMDKFPLKLAKWLVYGQWYTEIKVDQPGQLLMPMMPRSDDDPSVALWRAGDKTYKVPRDATPYFRPGQYLNAGDVLWSGLVTAGDHVFVDRIRWQLARPRRGNVIVFWTDGIPDLPPQTHYIKRLVGMPNESLRIDPPNLVVNGVAIKEPRGIRRIVDTEPGYGGYQVIGPNAPGFLRDPRDTLRLRNGEYLALGDNTANSKDGRYWGAVPEQNLIGPAVVVYWPFSERWGRIE